MPKYSKKIQVLLTEDQYKTLEEISSQRKKKLGFLVREAIEEYHLRKRRRMKLPKPWTGCYPCPKSRSLKIIRNGKRSIWPRNTPADEDHLLSRRQSGHVLPGRTSSFTGAL